MAFWQAENKLLATSQSVSYAPAGTTDDDGGLGKGASKTYESLTAGQFSSTTDIIVGAVTESGHTNNCVVDKKTGLIWNKDPSTAIYHAGLAEHLLWDAEAEAADLANHDIFGYADGANTAGLSGFTDWRVPNILEMTSIMEYEANDARPDPTYFGTPTIANYWTSTTRPNSTTQALPCHFGSGSVAAIAKTTAHYATYLVRG